MKYYKILPFLLMELLFFVNQARTQNVLDKLPLYQNGTGYTQDSDWLLQEGSFPANAFRSINDKDLIITNGLVSRTFRITPYFACYSYKNEMTGKEMLRAIRPEAVVEINGTKYKIGGVKGLFEHAYLKEDWLDKFEHDRNAFHFTHFKIRTIQTRFPWKPGRWNTNATWPPKGKEIVFFFDPPGKDLLGVSVQIHYEMYDGIPLMSKWISISNKRKQDIRINTFKNEILAMVEEESTVGGRGQLTPHIKIESDYAFDDMTSKYSDQTTTWLPDTLYTSQVNYGLSTPCLLVSKPPIGPWLRLHPNDTFKAFHTYELMYDSYDKERCGLAERKMYRVIAPWVTENPMFLHLTTTDPEKVKAAIDQCAAIGFEMVILSFGSGLNMEDTSAANIAKFKALVDYAHKKGIELGGYSLFSSRHIDSVNDVINPKTGRIGGTIFGNAPCLGSEWGLSYIKKLKTFITKTGFDVLENDGPYPGDICASTKHPGHEGMKDSQWKQWRFETDFYKWLRGKGLYLNAPDWYFLSGSNKVGMGYREVNWSLPRARQIVLERQNIYDGTWTKTPSMGWMFVPLVEYLGGGAAATIEPLSEHLYAYKMHLIQNFGSGVQACYRGPRLYDTPETKAMVKGVVNWYKEYRAILNSDIIHLRRADGRDWDGILHINPRLENKGLAILYNPLDKDIERTIKLPLYYSGLKKTAQIGIKGKNFSKYKLNRDYAVEVSVKIPAKGYTWLVIK